MKILVNLPASQVFDWSISDEDMKILLNLPAVFTHFTQKGAKR